MHYGWPETPYYTEWSPYFVDGGVKVAPRLAKDSRWYCEYCNAVNDDNMLDCHRCGANRPRLGGDIETVWLGNGDVPSYFYVEWAEEHKGIVARFTCWVRQIFKTIKGLVWTGLQ